MFLLHDRTRRRICIGGFFLLCIAPTALTLLWAAARHWPGGVEAEARQLSRRLGLEVALDGLRHLRPGLVLYEGLELADPETGQKLLRCRVVEAHWTEAGDCQGQRKPCLVLLASQPQLEAAGVDCLGQLLRRLLQRQGGAAEVDVRLTADSVTVKTAENFQTLTDFQGSIELLPGGVQAQAAFRLAGVEMPNPARVRLLRNRQTVPPASAFELDTGGGPLPCGLLALGLPELKSLGPRSRLRGYIWANENCRGRAAGWDGEVTGQLFDLDLERLVSEQFPHKLSGTAQLTIHSAHFRQGRLEDVNCTLSAGPGVISRSLMDAAVARLSLQRGVPPSRPGELVPYQQLMLALVLDAEGVRLQGRSLAGGQGTILADAGGRLLGEPALQRQPVAALLQTLVPQSEVQVPATRQSDWLMRHLPLPRVVPPPGTEMALPHAQLRLGPAVRK
jgi:hypothetical protein